jgi:predicted helicase
VLVLAVDEMHVSRSIQKLLTENASELRLDDASKIIGCWKALSKIGLKDDVSDDQQAMRRAVAFCKDIKTSERIAEYFPRVIEAYISHAENFEEDPLRCSVQHVDGTFNATRRKEKLDWLKAANRAEGNSCNILSNARCLTEGVDVPSLDGILFLNPRKSQIDIVQAVGRVMRKAEGKKRGYIILPIGIPAGVEAERALNDNERYRTVWQILQALRAHDDRFDAMINKIDLGADVSSKMEVVAVTDALKGERGAEADNDAIGLGAEEKNNNAAGDANLQAPNVQTILQLEFGKIEKGIYAKIVKKCGNRQHWEDWAGDIAKIAQTHITRITAALEEPGTKERKAFDKFIKEIRDDLNESITESEAIEMLAQHIITKPVFDALFEGYDFAANNPVSVAMQKIIKLLDKHNLKNETASLETFYASVQFRAQGITDPESKQRIIKELYDKFFKKAFPRLTEKLGIVYTPIEVVDFIIHSVNDVLKAEFGETLGSKGVHILDPFVGTGTFITRLMQSGLISPKELEHKYAEELHANEIVLLAYYIAAINIESVYHSITQKEYKPFSGICLTDTFQLYEKQDMYAELMVDNSNRRMRQKKLDIKVIIGNPPYSAGQGSANDNNTNVKYPNLDESIRTTYAAHSSATNKNALYDSYIRAIRWGTDRIGKSGVMAYVSNAGWLDGNAADGLRQCLAEEFTSIYVFHLRGNARSSGEMRRKEKGNVFGEGTRTPIAISLFIKNPNTMGKGKIYFHDIGDYLSREEKLETIKKFGSIKGISEATAWRPVVPDKHHDWLKQRDDSFDRFISLGDKKDKSSTVVFENYSSGVKTNRDAWCYNSSRKGLFSNISRMIEFYNSEVRRFASAPKARGHGDIKTFIDTDSSKIGWSDSLVKALCRNQELSSSEKNLIVGVYRPFNKQWHYFHPILNERVYQMPRIFPNGKVKNRVIAVTGIGAGAAFSALMADALPNLHTMDTGQCFPLKLYEEERDEKQVDWISSADNKSAMKVRDGITDEGLKHFKAAYPGEKVNKEDIFYYIYGLLHSEEYRTRFADNLSKELPRIPCVKKAHDFWAFTKAGRKLADLHIGYEDVEPYPVEYGGGLRSLKGLSEKDLRVEEMKFGKDKDKTTVIYNHKITMKGIPAEAYSYVVNGKPALEWVMERQCVSTHKDSGIVNDANLYATETVGDPAYPILLFQRVIRVSLETMKIVRSLPKLDI